MSAQATPNKNGRVYDPRRRWWRFITEFVYRVIGRFVSKRSKRWRLFRNWGDMDAFWLWRLEKWKPFRTIHFPIIVQVFTDLIAQEIGGVQPMTRSRSDLYRREHISMSSKVRDTQ